MMSNFNKLNLSYLVLLLLAGCGSSDSDESSEGEKQAGYLKTIVSPADHSEAELVAAHKEKITTEYTGNSSKPDVDEVLVQKAMSKINGSKSVRFRGFDILDQSDLAESGAVNTEYSCWDGGAVKVTGSLSETSESKLTLNYNNCSPLDASENIQGQEHIKVNSSAEEHVKLSSFFNDILFSENGGTYKLTGYQILEFTDKLVSEGVFERSAATYLMTTSVIDQSQTIQESELSYRLDQNTNTMHFKLTGKVVDSDFGEVSYIREADTENSYYEKYEFKGPSRSIKLERDGYTYTKLMVDEDNDGSYDVGSYISSISEFENLDLSSVTLVDLNRLSLPPNVNPPYVVGYDHYTTDSIVVEEGYYDDPDTPTEELQVSYNWYVNGVLVEGEHTNTLPPYNAGFGDTLEVSMVVSDGHNVIESSRRTINLLDSPAVVAISNLPESIQAGDLVTFNVQIRDPDNLEEAVSAAKYMSGPDGVSYEDGSVTWQAPSKGYFPEQEYLFVFSNPSNVEEIKNVKLTVSGLADMTLARSGIEVPYLNYSMWVGDFDGDGKNEVLSTDSRHRVFIQSSESGGYGQSWMYPFKVPTGGDIKQVIGANVDEDEALEILVVTEDGISLINGLDNMATVVLEQANMQFAALADANHDGTLELAYIAASDDYGNDSTVHVVPLEDPTNELLNNSFIDSKEITFANVDGDDALELVTNSGMVFDGDTWESQWLSGSKFGEYYVAAGDFDGDGVAEIAGSNSGGDIKLFSAQTKEQITSIDNFNTCAISAVNIDADNADELIVADCQGGDVRAYDLSDGILLQKWSLDTQGFSGTKSLAFGDSDNDGQLEAHWGTGQGSSGEDVFVVADINGDTVEAKESALSIQLGSYSSAGWINTLQEDIAGIFFIPRTNSGYDGSRLLTLDFNGNQTLSDEISSNWDYSSYAAVTDFNNDGEEDIFLPTTKTYDGSFGVKQISDMSDHWSIPGDNDDIGVIVAKDINGDSYDDAIYVSSSKLNAIDVENQNILFSYSFDSFIRDFSVSVEAGETLIAAVRDQRLHLMQKTSSSLTELDFVDENCIRAEFGNFDQEEGYELVCLTAGDYWYSPNSSVILYKISDNKLVETSRSEVPYKVLDITVDTSKDSEQELFITTQLGDDSVWYDDNNKYQIAKLSANGHVLWLSPALIGQPTHRGLNFMHNEDVGHRLMLSTSLAMYMLNN